MEFIVDALLDSIKLLPFLFVVYLLIGYLEEHTDNKLYRKLVNAKWIGPIIGSSLGCLPQCGFSVVGANLYSRRMISVGTLLAIFISTSDEAIPILMAYPEQLTSVALVLGLKFMIAIIMGLSIDLMLNLWGKKPTPNLIEADKNIEIEQSCGCHQGHHSHEPSIWKSSLLHTFKIFVYILVINLALNAIIGLIGEDSLSKVLLTDSMWQPVLAAIVGMIPNCAASIILTQMYLVGNLSLGSLIAGLITGAGIGLVILFKANKNLLQNIKIMIVLYCIGVGFGMLIQMIL